MKGVNVVKKQCCTDSRNIENDGNVAKGVGSRTTWLMKCGVTRGKGCDTPSTQNLCRQKERERKERRREVTKSRGKKSA